MTITLPERFERALNNRAAEYGQTGPDYLKSLIIAACHAQGGVALNLDMPPPKIENDPAQTQLPLVGEHAEA